MNLRPSLLAWTALFSFATALPFDGQPAPPGKTVFTNRLVLGQGAGRLVSPDGRYVLFAASSGPQKPHGCRGLACDNLWLKDEATHKRTWIAERNSDLSAGWSPDGAAFYVQDRQASDMGILTLYKNTGDRLLSVDRTILRFDPAARELFHSSHHYFQAVHWIDGAHLLVSFNGHTDHYPSRCFDLKYSSSPDGKLKKLSAHFGPVSSVGCKS